MWATEIAQLLAMPGVSNAANEGMVGEVLAGAGNIRSREDTLFRSIKRLPAAHSMVVSSKRVSKHHYWDIDPDYRTRYSNPKDYTDHFLEILRSSIECRLRSHMPVATELSGGLDSSSIVVLAEQLRLAQSVDVEAFALVFPGIETCDETPYIHAVAKCCGCSLTEAESTIAPLSWFKDRAALYRDFPWLPTGATFDQLRALVAKRGCRVLLNGMGGDEWLTGSTLHYADYLREFEFGSLVKQLRADVTPELNPRLVPAVSRPDMTLLRSGLWPLLPESLKGLYRLMRRAGGGPFPSWINPEFAARIDLQDRLQPKPPLTKFKSLAQQAIYNQLNVGSIYQGNEWAHHYLATLGIELRSPFMDRRLIEFALSIPEDWRWRELQTKYILRESMRDLLPEKVRSRRTKADFSHIFAETMSAEAFRDLVHNLKIAELGWVNGDRVREMYLEMIGRYQKDDLGYIDLAAPIWMIIGIELWYTFA